MSLATLSDFISQSIFLNQIKAAYAFLSEGYKLLDLESVACYMNKTVFISLDTVTK